jgi:hypothetical protein
MNLISKLKNLFNDKELTITLPSLYTINNLIEKNYPEWVINDVKSQLLNIINENNNFKRKLIKSGKVLVKFETKEKHKNISKDYPKPKQENIYIHYLNNELHYIDTNDKYWIRNQKLKQLLD